MLFCLKDCLCCDIIFGMIAFLAIVLLPRLCHFERRFKRLLQHVTDYDLVQYVIVFSCIRGMVSSFILMIFANGLMSCGHRIPWNWRNKVCFWNCSMNKTHVSFHETPQVRLHFWSAWLCPCIFICMRLFDLAWLY